MGLISLFARGRSHSASARSTCRRRASPRLAVEALEDRTIPGFLAPVSYPRGLNDVAVGDLNKDGIPDIVSTADSSNTVSVRLGNGDGTFGTAKTIVASANYVALGDFNGDGKIDVVGTNTNGLSVLLGNGDGTLRMLQKVSVPKGQIPEFIAAGDLNSDGIPDLAVAGCRLVTVQAVARKHRATARFGSGPAGDGLPGAGHRPEEVKSVQRRPAHLHRGQKRQAPEGRCGLTLLPRRKVRPW
jgi:hypothetical protein